MFYVGLLIVRLCVMSDIVLHWLGDSCTDCTVFIYSVVQLQVSLINLLTYLHTYCWKAWDTYFRCAEARTSET